MKGLLLVILLFLAGCGNESVNEAKPSPGDVSYSSSPEIDPFVDSSDSAEPVASSSSEVVIEESSSSLQVSSSAVESSSVSLIISSSGEIELSSSSMQQSYCMLIYHNEAMCRMCEESSSSMMIVYGEMTDERDGQTYKTITIDGRATWMAENLNYAYLQPTAELDSSSWCYINEPDSCAKYGRLYLWSAVMDSAGLFSEDTKGCGYYSDENEWYKCPKEDFVQGVCPPNWHVPTSDEFGVPLSLAKESVPCGEYTYWSDWSKGKSIRYFGNTIMNPNNLLSYEWVVKDGEYSDEDLLWLEKDMGDKFMGMGFNIRPAGKYNSEETRFEYNFSGVSIWFSSEDGNTAAATFALPELILEGCYDPRTVAEKKWAFPVRCVKDEEVEE